MLSQLISDMENDLKIGRRTFLKEFCIDVVEDTSKPYVFGLTRKVFAETPQILYSKAKDNPKKKQEYLDQLLENTRDFFPYIGKLTYEENPLVLYIKDLLDTEMVKEKGKSTVFIDSEKLRRAYSYVILDPSQIGKGQKSEVYVFPLAFDSLTEDELKIILYEENEHCRDISEGLRLDNEIFDASILDPYVRENIFDLRARFAQLQHIMNIGRGQGESFLQRVRLPFIKEREVQYVASYMDLKELLEQGQLSPYESDVVKKHLSYFGGWIKPGLRYKE